MFAGPSARAAHLAHMVGDSFYLCGPLNKTGRANPYSWIRVKAGSSQCTVKSCWIPRSFLLLCTGFFSFPNPGIAQVVTRSFGLQPVYPLLAGTDQRTNRSLLLLGAAGRRQAPNSILGMGRAGPWGREFSVAGRGMMGQHCQGCFNPNPPFPGSYCFPEPVPKPFSCLCFTGCKEGTLH